MSRKLLLAFTVVVMSSAAPARADVGLGIFLGYPTALDLKLGFDHRSALDIAFGIDGPEHNYGYYLHASYLATLGVARGNAVDVPVRLGIGGAIFWDNAFDGFAVGARVPLELALRFRRAPIEIYGEIAPLLVFVDPAATRTPYFDLQGGIGLRVYF